MTKKQRRKEGRKGEERNEGRKEVERKEGGRKDDTIILVFIIIITMRTLS